MTIDGLSAEVMAMLNRVFIQYPEIEWVKLYGSRAKGNFHDRSDIDLAAYGRHLNRAVIADILLALDETDIPYQMDLQNYAELKNHALIEHIDRRGIVIYRRSDNAA